MPAFRRVTAIVLQIAVMTMPLVGSGFRCDDDSGHAAHMAKADMSMPDMPGMPMPGDDGTGSKRSDSDCSFPWSPGECQSMASCASSAMSVEQPTVAMIFGLAHDEPIARYEGLRSVTRAPEPPPPRA